MGRRRLVVLLSAITMMLIGAGIVGGLVAATQSDGGREWIRAQLVRQLSRGVNGRLVLGRITGSFLTDVAVDSVAIVDQDDSVFIASGPVHVTYDPRDLIDGRIIVRSVELLRPLLVMRREADGAWNAEKVFPPAPPGPVHLPRSRSAFGALVQFRNVRIRGFRFQLTVPWTPDDSLSGRRRDSAIVKSLLAPEHQVRAVTVKGKRGYQRTTSWTDGNFTFTSVRLRQPDRPGLLFEIARFDVKEESPPFDVRNMRGSVLWRGDSIWLDIPHLELPGSVVGGLGTIFWGGGRPARLDLKIRGDSVSLRDVSWIAPSVPSTGGGAVELHIKSERDEHVTDYVISSMNLRTNESHLRGAMTFGVGGPVLILKDVQLDVAPLDFALLETMAGGKFAQPWNGSFTGTVRARGGPLNRFQVDDVRLSYADRNVPGATAAFAGSGELDVLSPGNTIFHGFNLALEHFDLRTAQFLSEGFPRLNGVISGTATLDSAWTDVRFRDADVTHRDGDSTPPSRFKGDGRVTLGAENVGFDLVVAALPLSLTTIARSYPALPLRGEYTGPMRLHGDATDFSATVDLLGDAGRLQLEGQFDAARPGFRAVARGSVQGLDVRLLLAKPGAPATNFNGRFVTSVEFDSLANAIGTARLSVDRSVVDGVRVFTGQAAVRFTDGAVTVDSLRVESSSGTVTARGGLGLRPSRADSLQFRLDVDSLGGLRRFLVTARNPTDTAAAANAAANAAADSLGGSISATGTISGSVSRFALRARATAAELRVGTATARQAAMTATVVALPDSARGTLTLEMDTVRTGGLAFSRAIVRDSLAAASRQRASVELHWPLDSARATADVRVRGDSIAILLDSLAVRTSSGAWTLRQAAQIDAAKGSIAFGTITLGGAAGGGIEVRGSSTADSAMAFTVRADSVPLTDVGEIMQSRTRLDGTITLRADVSGTRRQPVMSFDAALRQGQLLGLRLDELTASGGYANRRLSATMLYSRLGIPALRGTATLPIDLALSPVGPRLLEEPLAASIHTDSGGMGVIAALSKAVTKASGSLALDVDASGTWKHPLLNGALVIHDGDVSLEPLGAVRLTAVEGNVAFRGDSIGGTITARSGKTKPATGELSGSVGIRDLQNPTFTLKLATQSFNVIDRARFATLDLTGVLDLTGSLERATLSGALTVDRGTISIPDLFQKHLISLDDPEFYKVVDTSAFEDRRLLPSPPSALMNNLTVRDLRVRMGRDVWLKSSEANINLGGEVTIQPGRSQRGAAADRTQFALVGALQTVRGTYRLDLGVVKRTFTVENGDVRFFGDPDLNGALNINAQYTVRQASQQGARPDVHVDVHIGGTMNAPTATLSSPDSQRVSQADLISYLATGQPSNQIGGVQGDYASTAVNVFLSNATSGFGAGATGGLCDDAQLSTANVEALQGVRSVGGGILSGAQFNCARQLGDKFFIRLDYGLCQVGQLVGGGTGSSDPLTFADAIGVKLDYQITPALTLSGGIEPPTSAVLCTRDASARGFYPTPRQFGIDLFRVWRF